MKSKAAYRHPQLFPEFCMLGKVFYQSEYAGQAMVFIKQPAGYLWSQRAQEGISYTQLSRKKLADPKGHMWVEGVFYTEAITHSLGDIS